MSAKLGQGRGAERTNQASNQIHTCAEVRQKLVTGSLLETEFQSQARTYAYSYDDLAVRMNVSL